MNILYIHQHFSTRNGYTGTRSYEFSQYLLKQGCRVHMICGNNRKANFQIPSGRREYRTIIDGIELNILNVSYAQMMGFWSRIWRFIDFAWRATIAGLRAPRPAVVFATSTPITVAIPGLLISWIRGVPFVFEVRDIWPESAVATGALTNKIIIAVAALFERLVYRAAKRVVVISERMKHRLVRDGKINKAKVAVVHIGADIDLFGHPPNKVLRQRLEMEKAFIAIFAGAHGQANGLDLLIHASRHLLPHVRIVLIGEGREKPALIKLAEDLSAEQVIFLDPVPKKEVAEILAEADCCCMILKRLELFETACPNKFFDYIASGKPVVVNFPGEIKELLTEADAGIFVAQENAKSMAAALNQLAGQPERCRKMGRNARALAERFDRYRMAEHFYRVLFSVVHQQGK